MDPNWACPQQLKVRFDVHAALLRDVASVAPDAWLAAGAHIHQPYFDGRFGPRVEAPSTQLLVQGAARARELGELFQTRWPQRRWTVLDVGEFARARGVNGVDTIVDALGCSSLVCSCVGLRWRDGRLEVAWGHEGALADLEAGRLCPTRASTPLARARARSIAEYYPGVSAPFIGHEPVEILNVFSDAMRAVSRLERGGRRRWSGVTLAERAKIEAIARRRGELPRRPRVLRWPAPATPSGDPWTSPDVVFRAWIVAERDRDPARSYLAAALARQANVEQKPTHQGWRLHLHALHSLLELETDHLPRIRRALRVAMLWHDVGKAWNMRTPGAHPFTGAKQWSALQLYPLPGIDVEEQRQISDFIAIHDVFGRLERALWDPDYRGGLSPADARAMLRIEGLDPSTSLVVAKTLWRADVRSVSLLAWLDGLADDLEALISM